MKPDSKLMMETIGIVGVIASLIFVGMQLVLDRRIAVAEQYQNRSDMRLQTTLGLFENKDYVQDRVERYEARRPSWLTAELDERRAQNNQSMSALVRQSMQWEMVLIGMDNNYFQYQQGLLNETQWQTFRELIKNSLRNPMRRSYISNLSSLNLKELINELEEELDSEN